MKRTILIISIIFLAGCISAVKKEDLKEMPVTQIAPQQPGLLLPMEELPVVQLVEEAKEREKYFSLSVTNMELRNVLFALAGELPEYNIVVDPDVSGNVTASFRDLPLEKVMKILLEPFGLEYTIEDTILRISHPRMATRTFKFNYSTSTRTSKSTLMAVTGGGGEEEGSTASFGSTGTEESVNIWNELESGIRDLLSATGRLSINKRAGHITVTDYRNNLRIIEDFIRFFKREAMRQIHIRAKLLEITLKDGFEFGINWDVALKNIGGSSKSTPITFDQDFAPPKETSDTFFSPFAELVSITQIRGDLSTVLRALEVQGKVTVLSSPEVTTLNGQTAIIRSVREDVVFQKEESSSGGVALVSVTADPFTFGVFLSVTPHADSEGMITMDIHPSVSSLVEIKSFPTDNPAASRPIIDTRETEAVVSVKNGEMIIIAGLMKDAVTDNISKVPLLGDIPYIGKVFRREIKKREKTELVILLSPSIVGTSAKDFGTIRTKYKMLGNQFP